VIGQDLFECPHEIMQATCIVADAMRTNRNIVHLDFDCWDENVWKSTVEPYVQRNLLASNLNKLASEADIELRAALPGHLLQSNRDNINAIFQLLVQTQTLF
jgi:hypothetical protein